MAFVISRSHCLRGLKLGTRQLSSVAESINSPLHFHNGQRCETKVPGEKLKIYEPATGQVMCSTTSAGETDVDQAVTNAHHTYTDWGQRSGTERGQILLRAAQIIREHIEDIARVETHDTGKPLWEARCDVEGCADAIEFYGGLASTLAGQHFSLPGGSFAYTRREPLGVVGGIGAWNYPFQMASWKSAPALACGNTMVFKPSPLTPLSAVLLAEVYTDAGLPPGAFNVIQGEGATGQFLSNHPKVAKMTFTGSVPSGSKVMEACAKGIKYVTLELGGKSPVIVFDDCDVENAVKGTMMANFLNQGQVCSNGTRVFVQRGVWDSFVSKLVARTKAMKIGDPFLEDTRVGATISREQAERVLGYVTEAKAQGANILCGGERVTLSDPSLAGGHYLTPCVVTNVSDDMRVSREEVFGALACIYPFDDEAEVIDRANDTEFGLAGGVFTKDLSRAHRVVSQIQAGNLYINNYNVYPAQLPFGGYKKSGLGRECGTVSLDYYTQVKTVYVEMQDVECPL